MKDFVNLNFVLSSNQSPLSRFIRYLYPIKTCKRCCFQSDVDRSFIVNSYFAKLRYFLQSFPLFIIFLSLSFSLFCSQIYLQVSISCICRFRVLKLLQRLPIACNCTNVLLIILCVSIRMATVSIYVRNE